MDLFYQQDSIKDQIKILKKDIKHYAEQRNIKLDKSFKILFGNASAVGNNIFIIQPPYEAGTPYFKGEDFDYLINILDSNNVTNYFTTYCSLLPHKDVGKKDIVAFSCWIHKLIEIAQPHTIVVLGESAPFTFVSRKCILKDTHGTVIDNFAGIPIIITYEMTYYTKMSQYEDISYKNFLREKDWGIIIDRYRRQTK